MRQLINSLETTIAEAEAEVRQAALALALQQLKDFVAEGGYVGGTIDLSYLKAAYQQGVQALGVLRAQPAKYRRLDEALKAGARYLNGEVTPPQPFNPANLNDFDSYRNAFSEYLTGTSTSSFYGYQAGVDAATEAIMTALSAI